MKNQRTLEEYSRELSLTVPIRSELLAAAPNVNSMRLLYSLQLLM